MAIDPNALNQIVTDAASGPASVSGDAGSVQQHSLRDLVAMHQYLSGVLAANSPTRGLRFNRLVPGSAVGRSVSGSLRLMPLPATFDHLGI